MPKGKIIVFEGIDKAGKTTQAKLLEKKLGGKCVRIDFPDYTTHVGKEIKQFLDGKRNYPDEVKMILLSANRWEKKGRNRENGWQGHYSYHESVLSIQSSVWTFKGIKTRLATFIGQGPAKSRSSNSNRYQTQDLG